MPKIEPWAAGWEAIMADFVLYSPLIFKMFLQVCNWIQTWIVETSMDQPNPLATNSVRLIVIVFPKREH